MARVDQQPGAREEILSRIRTATKKLAPRRESQTDGLALFHPITDPLQRFQTECTANHMEVMLVTDTGTARTALQQVLESLPAGEIFVQDTPELRRLFPDAATGRGVRWSSEGGPRNPLRPR